VRNQSQCGDPNDDFLVGYVDSRVFLYFLLFSKKVKRFLKSGKYAFGGEQFRTLGIFLKNKLMEKV
jgi:hypothetical protein